MRGLLVKDLRLLAGQKRFFVVVVAIGLFFMLSGQDPIFTVSYCTLLLSFFTASTISYDEFNHGFFYLFSLPVSRKGYVAWVATTVIGGLYGSMAQEDFLLLEWIAGAVGILVVLVIFLCLTLPVQFKFGSEKGRIVISVGMIALFLGLMAFLKMDGVLEVVAGVAERIASLGTVAVLGVGVLFFAIVVAVSVAASVHIMEKKQLS